MNRRAFLAAIAGAAVAPKVLPADVPLATLAYMGPLPGRTFLNPGDVFTIEGYYAKDLKTGECTGELQKFVAGAPVTV